MQRRKWNKFNTAAFHHKPLSIVKSHFSLCISQTQTHIHTDLTVELRAVSQTGWVFSSKWSPAFSLILIMTLYTPRHNVEVTAGRKDAHCLTSECEGNRERTGHIIRIINSSLPNQQFCSHLVLTHGKPPMWLLLQKFFQPIKFEGMLFLTSHWRSCWIGQNRTWCVVQFNFAILFLNIFYSLH